MSDTFYGDLCLLLFTAIDMAAEDIATDQEDRNRYRALYISEASIFLNSDESLSYRAQCIEHLKQLDTNKSVFNADKTARQQNYQSTESQSNNVQL